MAPRKAKVVITGDQALDHNFGAHIIPPSKPGGDFMMVNSIINRVPQHKIRDSRISTSIFTPAVI